MKLSPNFTLAEFACKCGCKGELQPEILINLVHTALMLEKLRAALGGKPLKVTSGYRCPKHNASPEVGGADGSHHKEGKAGDVKSDYHTPAEVQRVAKTIPECKGIGENVKFTHVDTRPVRHVFQY